MTRTIRPDTEAGITLIELMIAVAIVAILTTVAMVGYSKYIRNARLVDARETIGRIQMAQEAHFERTGTYCDATTATGWQPALAAGFEPRDWGTPVAAWTNCFGTRIKPDSGKTFFSYQVMADTSALSGAAGAGDMNMIAGAPWYYVLARADMDNQGGTYTELRANSQKRKIWIINKGL
ncbi:MAG: prepilin-type N-terminal cleavage/methylation domain-containing protein [Deltaproteobacteria bacterium]|nr:prepilin-type N-terminal cleavage/methylation domain-containing protein [Deltaproteobacteria bacterium]